VINTPRINHTLKEYFEEFLIADNQYWLGSHAVLHIKDVFGMAPEQNSRGELEKVAKHLNSGAANSVEFFGAVVHFSGVPLLQLQNPSKQTSCGVLG
jgi:hypothetical protein